MRAKRFVMIAGLAAVGMAAGCRKNAVDKTAFKSAIDNYYASRQQCVWDAAVKFPAQADAKNDEQTRGFDALTDAGLLTRRPEEKKRFLIGSKQVNDYDLSDKGRSAWTPDTTQPGYGNFCYGHPAWPRSITTRRPTIPTRRNSRSAITLRLREFPTGPTIRKSRPPSRGSRRRLRVRRPARPACRRATTAGRL